MGPGEKKELTEEEILEQEEFVDIILNEEDFLFKSADEYDEENAELLEEQALLDKYGFQFRICGIFYCKGRKSLLYYHRKDRSMKFLYGLVIAIFLAIIILDIKT